MKLKRFAVILFLLFAGLEARAQTVTGSFYENKPDNPLAGALIALYGANDDLLIDHTYSLNNGRFTLKTPPSKGSFYIIATKDGTSRRVDFDYDPQSPPIYIEIKHEKSKSRFGEAITYGWDKFDYIITSVLGFVLGLGYKKYEAKRAAERSLAVETVEIKDLLTAILRDYAKLKERLFAHNKAQAGPAQEIVEQYRQIASRIRELVTELQTRLSAKSDMKTVIYTLHKKSGTERFAAFKNSITEIYDFTENPDRALTASQKEQAEYLQPFEDLKNNTLFK